VGGFNKSPKKKIWRESQAICFSSQKRVQTWQKHYPNEHATGGGKPSPMQTPEKAVLRGGKKEEQIAETGKGELGKKPKACAILPLLRA